jgi:hypothetical protein
MVLEDLNPVQATGSSFSDHSTSSGQAAMSAAGGGSGAKHGSFRSAFSSSSNTGRQFLGPPLMFAIGLRLYKEVNRIDPSPSVRVP